MPKSWNWSPLKPKPFAGLRGFPEADSFYGKGFRDGCEGGFKSVGEGGFTLLKYHIDGYSIDSNKEYATGYNDGFEQCVYVYDWNVI